MAKRARAPEKLGFFAAIGAFIALEHVPKKLIGFFDQNMLQLSESERFLPNQMDSSGWEALLGKPEGQGK